MPMKHDDACNRISSRMGSKYTSDQVSEVVKLFFSKHGLYKLLTKRLNFKIYLIGKFHIPKNVQQRFIMRARLLKRNKENKRNSKK